MGPQRVKGKLGRGTKEKREKAKREEGEGGGEGGKCWLAHLGGSIGKGLHCDVNTVTEKGGAECGR